MRQGAAHGRCWAWFRLTRIRDSLPFYDIVKRCLEKVLIKSSSQQPNGRSWSAERQVLRARLKWSLDELTQHICQSGLVARLSTSTLRRWLHQDAIRPWQHRCWIFPRDPGFAPKAGRILDLYQHQWQGQPLQADEFVLSIDEKTSIQARGRLHETQPPRPGVPMKVEHEYERKGAWAYLAAWDVHRAKLFGRCEDQSGLLPLID